MEYVLNSRLPALPSRMVSERLNRMLVKAARSMMTHAGVSNAYWAEAVATAVYLRNLHLKSGETPYRQWYGKKPNLQHI